ncbi:MAG: hypothetical protein ACI4QR_00085 [Eubacteriales bacterium]
MKTSKRIFILSLAFMLAAVSFFGVSCKKNPDKSKTLYAVYNEDEYVYADDTDFTDILWTSMYNTLLETGKEQLTSEEYSQILESAIRSTILFRTLEKDLKNKGYSVDKDEIKTAATQKAEYYEANYTGGYSKFLEDWHLSKNAFETTEKYSAMLKLVSEKLIETNEVSKEDAYKYYLDNSEDYYNPPAYEIYSLVLQVKNTADEASKEETLADAKAYISRLNAGESWEDVKKAAFIKYNVENGAPYSYYLTGKERVSLLSFKKVTDLDAAIAQIEASFKEEHGVSFSEMFPNGFDAYVAEKGLEKGSSEYKKALEIFYNYSAAVYIAEYNYVITTAWKDGATYEKPLYHAGFGCYIIVTFDNIKETAFFTPFDEVKEDIIKAMSDELSQEKTTEYLDKFYEELGVELKYNEESK